MDHPTDDLESYALGMLERDRTLAIDAHAASCDACAKQLGEAESTVAAMFELEYADAQIPETTRERIASLHPQPAPNAFVTRILPSRALAAALAVAAAFALIAGGFAARDIRLAAALQSDGALMHEMIASHFVHAQFRSNAGAPLDAKVVYERHGRWYEVLANGIDVSYRIAVVPIGGTVAILRAERFVKRGDAYALALPTLGDIDALELRDGNGRIVGRVRAPTSGGR